MKMTSITMLWVGGCTLLLRGSRDASSCPQNMMVLCPSYYIVYLHIAARWEVIVLIVKVMYPHSGERP